MLAESFDIIVVGGGINGVGVAQAAAADGYRVLLLEKNAQPGLETSSSSSKLIHGGLRYLESLEFSLVRESLQERELLLRLAPQLVRRLTFNIPVYPQTGRSRLTIGMGLWLYYLLAGMQQQHGFRRLPQADWNQLEGLRFDDLRAVFQYQDAQTDDTQLVRAVLASANSLGAECLCNATLIAARKSQKGVTLKVVQDANELTLHCALLVNASGPWVAHVNEGISPVHRMDNPVLVQGAHLVMHKPVRQAYYLEAPQDGRAVFLLPWKQHSLLGTTESVIDEFPLQPRVMPSERRYLLAVYRHYFPSDDNRVVHEMAGYRVLPAASNGIFQRSREIRIEADDARKPRVISMVGGKLTVYRRSALKVMRLAARTLPPRMIRADTAQLVLTPVAEDHEF